MLSSIGALVPWGLLVLGVRGGYNEAHDTKTDYMHVTVYDTTTLPITHTLDLTETCTVIVNETHTSYFTESTTSTLHFTESTTQTLHFSESTTITYHFNTSTTSTLYYTALITNTETDSATITTTETDSATITNTETDSTTLTNTATTTQTVPMTITTIMTKTEYTTTYDPCPNTCEVSAATVNLWFWPENRPYSYPTTYVDPSLQYTFTSPSVYMYIPTAKGVRTDGAPFGPSTSSWILPLDLYEVSTIANGSITTQLDLKDLRTNCPKSADEAEIATMLNSACDPILAAPKQVSSWAFPCNACGRFGLFDPPYAVPTATGGILGTTTTVVVSPAPTTPAPTPTSTQPVGTILVVYYSNGVALATATIAAPGVIGTITSSVEVTPTTSAAATATATSSGIVSSPAESSSIESPTLSSVESSTLGITSSSIATLSSQTASAPTTVATAAAPKKLPSGFAMILPGLAMAAFLL